MKKIAFVIAANRTKITPIFNEKPIELLNAIIVTPKKHNDNPAKNRAEIFSFRNRTASNT